MDREEIQSLLETLCPNVYFQPPANVSLQYPCIIYHRDFADTDFADNMPYYNRKRYLVTVIDQDPDSPLPDLIAALPLNSFNRFYTADNLNHDVFNVFF